MGGQKADNVRMGNSAHQGHLLSEVVQILHMYYALSLMCVYARLALCAALPGCVEMLPGNLFEGAQMRTCLCCADASLLHCHVFILKHSPHHRALLTVVKGV